jgi:hypothetical protein
MLENEKLANYNKSRGKRSIKGRATDPRRQIQKPKSSDSDSSGSIPENIVTTSYFRQKKKIRFATSWRIYTPKNIKLSFVQLSVLNAVAIEFLKMGCVF